MGTLYEAFGIIRIEAPSSKAKQVKKAIMKRFKRANHNSNISPPTPNPK